MRGSKWKICPPSHRKTIMIVDDEIYFRQLLRDILVEAGFTIVAEASNGIEAIDEYRKHRPEITIMDIFMAGRKRYRLL
jgi:two-component system chemotaxis response regulator CheY